MNTPTSRFCPVCHQPRGRHEDSTFCCEPRRFVVSRTVSLDVVAHSAAEARESADAMPLREWNIDTEEIAPA